MADTPYKKARRRADHIFRDLLPRYGLAVREGQLALCQQMLNALFFNKILLCDAGVGIGKTHAYLVACLLWRQFGPFFENRPITISTSSISLQEAIVRDYLPRLSDILLRHGILTRPLNVVVRKGKQHFVCDMRLAERQARLAESGKSSRLRLLNQCTRHYDLDAVPGLSGYDRRLICVPVSCPKTCEGYGICQYHQFVRGSMNKAVDIQICNHNYLLADASHRLNGQRPLLQDCGILIVDEAHKLPEAARQMDSFSLSLQDIFALTDLLEKDRLTIHAQRLRDCARSLWNALEQQPEWNGQASVQPLIAELETTLRSFRRELSPGMIYRLEEGIRQFSIFAQRDPRYVLYIQRTRKSGLLLCAVSRNTPLRLEQAFWAQGVPSILTSGTLAAGGSFAHTRQAMGLTGCERGMTFTAASPFDYEQNCLLYFPKAERAGEETLWLAEQISLLVQATHGHTLVLFTSYHLMDAVHRRLSNQLPFPCLQAWRGGQQVVQQFKALPNAVLFAAGPCWEGVDFPGDCVSSLILPRLPFPVPDAVSESERGQYPSLPEYIQQVIVPEMQKKLRQGFGRAIRTETDTCVVSILDRRAAPGGRYHQAALDALPPCGQADSIGQITAFIRAKKSPDYFIASGGQP